MIYLMKNNYNMHKVALAGLALTLSLADINSAYAEMIEDCQGTAMEILSCRNKNRVYKNDEAATQHYLQRWEREREYENAREAEMKAQSEANRQRAEEIKRQKAAEEAYLNSPAGKAEAAKREAAALKEWYRITEADRANREFWSNLRQKEKRNMLIEQARSRSIIEGTLQSYNKKAIPPETYVRLASQAVPNWALAAQLIKNGEQEYGGRFTLLSAVIETVTCPEHDFIDSHVTSNFCNPKYAEDGRKKMLEYLPKASDKDKVLICGYMFASWKSRLYQVVDSVLQNYSEERKKDYYADAAIYEKKWQDCEAAMGNDPALVRAREDFYTTMNTHYLRNGWGVHEYHNADLQQRWFMFVDPHLSTLADFSDATKVDIAMNTARALSLVKQWSGKKRHEKYTWNEVSPWVSEMNALVDLSPSPNDWLLEWDDWFEEYQNYVASRSNNDALAAAQKMLALAESSQGSQRDERIARSLVAVAEVLKFKEDYAGAEVPFRKAMLMFEKITPTSIPQSEIGIFYIHFAGIFISLNKYQESINNMKKGLIIAEKHFGKEHPMMVTVPKIQGRMHNNLQQYKEAAFILRKTYDLSTKLYGVNDDRTIEVKEDLIVALQGLHRDKEIQALK